MNHKDILQKQHLTFQYLNQKRLKDALDLISSVVKDTHSSKLIDNHYNIETTYKSLLRYTVEGFSDPERQKIYNQMVFEVFILADNTFGDLLIRFGEGFYYETLRKINHSSFSFEEGVKSFIEHAKNLYLLAENTPEMLEYPLINDSANSVFDFLMTQTSVWETNINTLQDIFTTEEVQWYFQCIFITAITIQLIHRFDVRGVNFLFCYAIEHSDIQVKQRALTGLLLIFYKYDNRIIHFPEMVKYIELLKEDKNNLDIIKSVIIQLLRTFETEELGRKLTDEILPEVVKIHPNLRTRLDLDNILGDNLKEGKNPDWEEVFPESPELINKLEEFSKLQIEGADLFMATFRMLKHYPFFVDIKNWFLPFYYPNPMIEGALKNEDSQFNNKDILTSFAGSLVMCNSDKYSFLLSIPQMPTDQKELMGKMFLIDIESLREVEESDKLIDTNKQVLAISNQYIQDLYRFHKLNPRKSSFIDPFSWSFDFYNKWFVNKLFPEDDFLNRLGEYLFEKDRYKEASEVFDILANRTDNNPSMQLIQKQGYCQQQLKNYEEALHLYLKADIFKHDQIWNLKKIALCYRYLKNPEKAIKYFKETEKIDPENLHTQVSIGHCLLEMKNYAEALKYYFKVEYLDPKNKKVWRPITWCSLALGKLEQAEKYAMKSINDLPAQSDYLNMGHIKWCYGNRKEALEWYNKCVKFEGNTIKDFIESFENDKQILLNHNVDVSDIPIMMDQLKYSLET